MTHCNLAIWWPALLVFRWGYRCTIPLSRPLHPTADKAQHTKNSRPLRTRAEQPAGSARLLHCL